MKRFSRAGMVAEVRRHLDDAVELYKDVTGCDPPAMPGSVGSLDTTTRAAYLLGRWAALSDLLKELEER